MEKKFSEIIKILEVHSSDLSLTEAQKNSITESITRIKAIFKESSKLIEQNDSLLKSNTVLNAMREYLTEDKVNELMKQQAKNDPVLAAYLASSGRLVKRSSSEIATYDMNNLNKIFIPNAEALQTLQKATESLYQNLWVVKERLNQIPKFKNFDLPGVRNVRNHLIVHVGGPGSGASIYSFGIATNGPVLRPTRPVEAKAPSDAGLKINIEEFLRNIAKFKL